MLELYFKYPRVLRRSRNGELGSEMDRIAGYHSEAGYKRESAKIYLSRLCHFSDHLSQAARSTPIGQAVIDAFVDAYPTKAPCRAVYRPRFLGHQTEPYAALATG
jgi:integrase/recombinase XerD